jgi:hypothetical protein
MKKKDIKYLESKKIQGRTYVPLIEDQMGKANFKKAETKEH